MNLLGALMERTLPLQRCVICGQCEDEVIHRNRSLLARPEQFGLKAITGRTLVLETENIKDEHHWDD
jgi:hypothetical protein